MRKRKPSQREGLPTKDLCPMQGDESAANIQSRGAPPFLHLCGRKSARRGRESIRPDVICGKLPRLSGGSDYAQRDILPACSPVRVMVEQSLTGRSQIHVSTNRGNLSTAESDEGD